MNRTAANTEMRVAGALNGITKLYDLKMGSHLSRAHVMNYLRDAGEPSYLASDVIRGLQATGVEILDAADNASAATPTSGLDGFFQQSQLVDLDWLAVDREAYRATEILPFQAFDIVPDLVEAWDHTDSAQGIHLVPARPHDPATMAAMGEKARRQASMHAASGVAQGIWHQVRMAMLDGKAFKDAKSAAFQTLDGTDMPLDMKRALHAHLVQGLPKVASEEGLIGNVFVVAQDFPKCHQGNVPDAVIKTRAPFVIAKTECQGCKFASFNAAPVEDTQAWSRGTANLQAQSNSCAQFRKQLVVDVPYTEELATRLQVQANSTDPAEIKASIRKAFTKKEAKFVPIDGKPIERDITAGIDPEEAAAALVQAQRNKEAAAVQAGREKAVRDIIAFTKRRMNEGAIGKVLIDKIARYFPPEVFQLAGDGLKQALTEMGLAGHHYIDASAYPDCHKGDVDNLHRVRASLMKARPFYVLKKTACEGCPCNRGGKCGTLGGALVDQMAYPGGRQAALAESLGGGTIRTAANEWTDGYGLQGDMMNIQFAGTGPDVDFDLQDSEFKIDW